VLCVPCFLPVYKPYASPCLGLLKHDLFNGFCCDTKRRKDTQEGRKHRDSRNQRNTPKRKASLTTQTSTMLHATTTHAQRAHQTPPQDTTQPRTPAQKPHSDPQRRDPQHRNRRSTSEESTVTPAGTNRTPSVPRPTGSRRHGFC
jgi:hypothetical protein